MSRIILISDKLAVARVFYDKTMQFNDGCDGNDGRTNPSFESNGILLTVLPPRVVTVNKQCFVGYTGLGDGSEAAGGSDRLRPGLAANESTSDGGDIWTSGGAMPADVRNDLTRVNGVDIQALPPAQTGPDAPGAASASNMAEGSTSLNESNTVPVRDENLATRDGFNGVSLHRVVNADDDHATRADHLTVSETAASRTNEDGAFLQGVPADQWEAAYQAHRAGTNWHMPATKSMI
ncbi:hypothetical protein C8F01DRAFT_1091582 [Mycena amicta]|nr:hypothetical protein C8F01DRAFT_1091582 [Mycena amicta]